MGTTGEYNPECLAYCPELVDGLRSRSALKELMDLTVQASDNGADPEFIRRMQAAVDTLLDQLSPLTDCQIGPLIQADKATVLNACGRYATVFTLTDSRTT